jgi:hypothetical protein
LEALCDRISRVSQLKFLYDIGLHGASAVPKNYGSPIYTFSGTLAQGPVLDEKVKFSTLEVFGTKTSGDFTQITF